MKNTGLWNRNEYSLVVEILVHHINVTEKDNALISETAYSQSYPLPFPARAGGAFKQRTENRNIIRDNS